MDLRTAMNKIAKRVDGVDHIWINTFSKTQLGKICHMKWRKKFFIPQLGEFASVDSFLAWLFTQDESMRIDATARLPQVSREEFKLARLALFYAKFHQLQALRPSLHQECDPKEGEKSKLDLPWFEYKIHTSGIIEDNQDTARVAIVKEMVKYILASELKARVTFKTEGFDYQEVRCKIMAYVKEKFQLAERTEESGPEQTDGQEVQPQSEEDHPTRGAC